MGDFEKSECFGLKSDCQCHYLSRLNISAENPHRPGQNLNNNIPHSSKGGKESSSLESLTIQQPPHIMEKVHLSLL